MATTFRRSQAHDREAILHLMEEARGEGLTNEEKSQQGFVQGPMDQDILARLESGPGIFVAEVNGEMAGFAMSAEKHHIVHNPPAIKAMTEAAATDPHLNQFLYGPTAVARAYQGQGILTGLLVAISAHLSANFDQGVAFVETTNRKSLSVHRHYGMTELASFEIAGREYIPFVFSPKLFQSPERAELLAAVTNLSPLRK
jgi:GNAT superfamily N-acetyltransferase